MPEVSIIVPVFQAEYYLSRCIDSILRQTFVDFEVLLIDDGSIDNSGVICDVYAEKDSRIRVFHRKNGGISSARNTGLDNATGKYIMFCDSDDYVEENWVSGLYQSICREKSVISVCGFFTERKDSNQRIYKSIQIESSIPYSEYYRLREISIDQFVWNKIFLNSVIQKHSLRFDESMVYGEDAVFVMNYVMAEDGQIGICCENTYAYQINEDSVSHKYIDGLWECYLTVFSTRDKLFNQFNIPKEKYITHYCSTLMWCIRFSISNCLSIANTASFPRKLAQVRLITTSKYYSEATRFFNFSSYPFLDRIAYRLKSPLLICILHYIRITVEGIKKLP